MGVELGIAVSTGHVCPWHLMVQRGGVWSMCIARGVMETVMAGRITASTKPRAFTAVVPLDQHQQPKMPAGPPLPSVEVADSGVDPPAGAPSIPAAPPAGSRGSAPPSNICTVYVPPLAPRTVKQPSHPPIRQRRPGISTFLAGDTRSRGRPTLAPTPRTGHPLDVTRLRRDEWSRHPRPPESRRRRIR